MQKKNAILIGALITALLGLALLALEHWGLFPSLSVCGEILDEKGSPIQNAKVIAQFGVAEESPFVLSGPDGKFEVRVSSLRWSNGKGPPGFNVIKSGYRPYWGYFKQWSWGPRRFNVTVRLRPSPQDQPITEDL